MGFSAGEEVAPADRASEHLQAIAQRWWVVLAAALVCAVLAYAFSWVQQPRYDATAEVLVSGAEPANILQHATAAPSLDPERDLDTAVALVTLDTTARRVSKHLHLSLTPAELLSQVSVAPEGTTSVLAITARDWLPRRAAKIANAFADGYVAARRRLAMAPYETAADQARRQLAALDGSRRRGAKGRALRAKLEQLETTGALQTGGASVVDRASTPTTPATPRPKFAAAVAAFVGTLLGLGAAMIAGARERRRYWRPSLVRPDVAAAPYTASAPPRPLSAPSSTRASD
jgi:uncharacterized protein involved in exopolysaccharide biosynthesis